MCCHFSVLSLVMLQCLQIKSHLQVSSSDYDSLQQRSSECRATLKLLEQLVQVSDGFCNIEKLIALKNYTEATQVHTSVRDTLTNIYEFYRNQLVIFPSLVRRRQALEEKLETCMKRRWTELIAWNSSPVVVTIASGPDAHEHLQQLCQSLHNLNSLTRLIAKLADQIMTEFVTKIFSDSVETSYDLDITQNSSTVSLKVVATESSANTSAVTHTLRKLSTFTSLIELLYENLLNIHVVDEYWTREKTAKDAASLAVGTGDGASAAGDTKASMLSGDGKSSRSLMSMFGEECSTACLQVLINNCLPSAIPSHRSELTQFSQVNTLIN